MDRCDMILQLTVFTDFFHVMCYINIMHGVLHVQIRACCTLLGCTHSRGPKVQIKCLPTDVNGSVGLLDCMLSGY